MKVRELVEELLKLDQDADIFSEDYDGDLNQPGVVEFELFRMIRPSSTRYFFNCPHASYWDIGHPIDGPIKAYLLEGYYFDERILPGDPPIRVDDVRVREDPAPGQVTLHGG